MSKIETNFKVFGEIRALLVYDCILRLMLFGFLVSIDAKIAWSIQDGFYRNIVPDARFNDVYFLASSVLLSLAFLGLWKNMWTGYVLFCLSFLLSLVQSACWGIQIHSPEFMVTQHVEQVLTGVILVLWVMQKRKQPQTLQPETHIAKQEP